MIRAIYNDEYGRKIGAAEETADDFAIVSSHASFNERTGGVQQVNGAQLYLLERGKQETRDKSQHPVPMTLDDVRKTHGIVHDPGGQK